jgi:hypothetical protein
MRSWQFAVVGLACLWAAGCRTRPNVALLEQESRRLEDQIFYLADLAKNCRRENARLQRRLERYEGRAGEPAGAPSAPAPAEPTPPRDGQPPLLDLPDQLQPLKIEVPGLEMPGEDFLERHKAQPAPEPPDQLPAPSGPDSPDWVPPGQDEARLNGDAGAGRADNTQVALITINERLTGGFNLDGRVGHEGLITVVEPRDAEGRLIGAAAPISVVVLDPALSGEAARIARWDFSPEEVARLYRKTPLSEGIHLEMVWPDEVPIHSRLHLFVRYTTDDGRRLEADRNIDVDVPALQAQWPGPAHPAGQTTPDRPPVGEWQQRESPGPQLPELTGPEPARTAARPAPRATVGSSGSGADTVAEATRAGATGVSPEPMERTGGTAGPPVRQRPAWSPDRPW